jgi:hypothetical protein
MIIHKNAATYRPAGGNEQKIARRGITLSSRASKWFFTPLLAPMLESRWLVLIAAGLGVGQVALVASGLGGWRCPIQSTLNVPCPGCGLTTAMTLLLKADWVAALRIHAFAPLAVMLLILMAGAGTLPVRFRRQLSTYLASLERRTGIAAIGLIGMIAYWLLRLI